MQSAPGERPYDVYGLGNAIMDVQVQVTDELVASRGLAKGTMALVSAEEQEDLLATLADHPRHSAAGGSAANTMVGVARFGGQALYAGKVGSDPAGELYRQGMAEAGVLLNAEPAQGSTGVSLVLVTPDGERTMLTSLGASTTLSPEDLDTERIAQSKLMYVEGYLLGPSLTMSAALHGMKVARSAGAPVALSFSDPTVVQQLGEELRMLAREHADIVFCNEHEAKLCAGVDDGLEALRRLGRDCPLVFMTCGGDGSLVWQGGEIAKVNGYRVPVVDTTGAGDVYAAGALYGLTHGMTPAQAGRLGSFASAQVVTYLGPRLGRSLAERIPAILDGAHPVDPA